MSHEDEKESTRPSSPRLAPTPTETDSSSFSDLGAPDFRGPKVSFLRLYRPLLQRGLGICLALASIAWLGERSREQTLYGDLVPAAPRAESRSPLRGESEGPVLADTLACPPPPPPPPCASTESPAHPALTADGKVILNEATIKELTTLTGIGEKRAEAILALRAKLGRFKKKTDLLRVRGLGPRSLQKLEGSFVLDRPTEESTTPPLDPTRAPSSAVPSSGAPSSGAPSSAVPSSAVPSGSPSSAPQTNAAPASLPPSTTSPPRAMPPSAPRVSTKAPS